MILSNYSSSDHRGNKENSTCHWGSPALGWKIWSKKVLPFVRKHRQDVFAPVCPKHVSQVKCYKHFYTAFSSLPVACGVVCKDQSFYIMYKLKKNQHSSLFKYYSTTVSSWDQSLHLLLYWKTSTVKKCWETGGYLNNFELGWW